MKPRHHRLALIAAGAGGARRRRRAGAERVPEQPGVLLHAHAGRRATKRRRDAPSASAAWSKRQPEAPAERAHGALHRHRHRADASRSIYTGILPDLFKEGKGVVAQGTLGADGVFHATEVLAKHDENYMPPEAARRAATRRSEGQGTTTPSQKAQPNDSRTRTLRTDPRAAASRSCRARCRWSAPHGATPR